MSTLKNLTFKIFGLFAVIAYIFAGKGVFGLDPAAPAGLTSYSDAVKTGVFAQQINIDYGDRIYDDIYLNTQFLYLLDMMQGSEAKTSTTRGFDRTMPTFVCKTSLAVSPQSDASVAHLFTLSSALEKNNMTVRTTVELGITVTDSAYTKYAYVSVKEGLGATEVKLLPIDPTKKIGANANDLIPAGTIVNVIGSWFDDYSGSVKPVSYFPTVIENYIQNFKDPYEYSDAAAKQTLYTKGTVRNQRDEDARLSHNIKLQKAVLFNGPSYKKSISQQTDTDEIGYMEGIIYKILNNSPNVKAYSNFSDDVWDEFEYNIFNPQIRSEYQFRFLVCNRALRRWFTNKKKARGWEMQDIPEDTYGLKGIKRITCDNGEFEIFVDPDIDARYNTKDHPFGLPLTLPEIEIKKQFPTYLAANIQPVDYTGKKSEYRTSMTVLVHQPSHHGLLYCPTKHFI